MDLAADFLSQPGTIGIYCFYASPEDHMNVTGLRTVVAALLGYRSICRIITRINFVTPADPRAHLLEKAGFRRLTKTPDKAAIYYCNPDTFLAPGRTISSRQPALSE
jgi:hypothetical protein